jgi:steroid 5-alpha reductase family enzyme
LTLLFLFAEWAVAALVMALLWLRHLQTRNARIVDAGLTGLIAAFAIADARLGHGFGPRRAAIAFMMGSWGLRLLVNLLYVRVFGRQEDERYARWRARWAGRANARFFWVFQAAAALAAAGSLPALVASMNRAPDFSTIELIAAGLWIVAFAAETTADRQFLQFTSDPANDGEACRAGLWRYSRHPDYWFEGLTWVGFALFAFAPQLTTSVFVPWLRR